MKIAEITFSRIIADFGEIKIPRMIEGLVLLIVLLTYMNTVTYFCTNSSGNCNLYVGKINSYSFAST